MGGEGICTRKCGTGEESLDAAFLRACNCQRWQCRFPPGAWLWDRAWPGARRPGGHVRRDRRTRVSGRRCPLPGGAEWACSTAAGRQLLGSVAPHPGGSRHPRSGLPCKVRLQGTWGRGSHTPPGRPRAPTHLPDSCRFCWSRTQGWGRQENPLSRRQEPHVDSSEALGQQCETRGLLCSLNPGHFHFQYFYSKMLNSLQWSAPNFLTQSNSNYISYFILYSTHILFTYTFQD